MKKYKGYRYVSSVYPAQGSSDSAYLFLPLDAAIALQREAGLDKGFVYDSDEDALEDYLSVNWATLCNEPLDIPR